MTPRGECVRSEERFEGLDALVADRGGALLATATLLAGSRAAGEDLPQTALERVVRHWRRVSDEPEIYLRRTIYQLAVDQWRSRRRRPEVLGYGHRLCVRKRLC
jgi:DNA-directed RNA polymerase specialized sigma24 family protein